MTNKCKYPEAMVRMIDYFYSDEGTLMVRAGPEAGTWDGEGGWKIVEENGKKKSVISWGKFDSFYLFRLYNAPLNMPYSSNDYMNFVMISGDYKNSWQSDNVINSGRIEVAKLAYPEVTFTTEEQQRMTIYVDIMNYVKQMETKFIIGEAPISSWDNYINTLKNMGIQDIIKIKQAAYDRWNKMK
jgi:putative aldouronate transport system substrate-binding protein